jgi:hypothetical protein
MYPEPLYFNYFTNNKVNIKFIIFYKHDTYIITLHCMDHVHDAGFLKLILLLTLVKVNKLNCYT